MTKTKKTVVYIIFCIMIVLSAFVFCGIKQNSKHDVFAYENDFYDETIKIKNDGTIISSNLWKALKNYYEYITEESAPIEDNEKYLTFDIFKDFPVNLLDLKNKNIEDITNLKLFDLSSFTKVDLSKNKLTSIEDELSAVENLEEIDLSQNKLTSFEYSNLNQSSYSQKLQKLDISQNEIISCDLTQIAQGEIDASLNYLEKDNLKLPNNLDVTVKLSHNLIDNPNTENQNIEFGFQGVKNEGTYVIGKKIYYFGFNNLDSISIFKLTYTGEQEEIVETETEYATLNIGESLTFEIGYFRIKFAEIDSPYYRDIDIYICPEKPTIKMYQDGKELDQITHKITSPVTIKFEGMEGATFVYSLNGSEYIEANEVAIDSEGINILRAYQVIDGYSSEEYTLFVEYDKPNTFAWVVVIAGIAIFAGLFYLAIKYMPNLAGLNLKNKDNSNKKKLD